MISFPGSDVHNCISKRLVCMFGVLFTVWYGSGVCATEPDEIQLEIREHLFYPPEFEVPAGKKFKLVVTNGDATPEEFESYELNREKVVMGGRQSILFVGPLPPGEYPFFGEYHPKTALGSIVVE